MRLKQLYRSRFALLYAQTVTGLPGKFLIQQGGEVLVVHVAGLLAVDDERGCRGDIVGLTVLLVFGDPQR